MKRSPICKSPSDWRRRPLKRKTILAVLCTERENLRIASATFNLRLRSVRKWPKSITRLVWRLKQRDNRTLALLKQGRREEALQHLKEAVRLEPGFEPAQRQLHALEAQGK